MAHFLRNFLLGYFISLSSVDQFALVQHSSFIIRALAKKVKTNPELNIKDGLYISYEKKILYLKLEPCLTISWFKL